MAKETNARTKVSATCVAHDVPEAHDVRPSVSKIVF